MVRCDLLCLFRGALSDVTYSIRLERGVLTHGVEVPVVLDKSWSVSLYPEREA